jgi:hypothetical protein
MEIRQGKPLSLLPPAPGSCEVCAGDHAAEEPHDADSLYWAFKAQAEGLPSPTWSDAIAHCDEDTQACWVGGLWELVKAGQVTEKKAGPLVKAIALGHPLPKNGAAVLGGSGPEPGSAVLGGLEKDMPYRKQVLSAVPIARPVRWFYQWNKPKEGT